MVVVPQAGSVEISSGADTIPVAGRRCRPGAPRGARLAAQPESDRRRGNRGRGASGISCIDPGMARGRLREARRLIRPIPAEAGHASASIAAGAAKLC